MYTENPALREVEIRLTSSDIKERTQQKTSCIIQPGLLKKIQHLERYTLWSLSLAKCC